MVQQTLIVEEFYLKMQHFGVRLKIEDQTLWRSAYITTFNQI